MATYGFPSLTINLDDEGGDLRDISAFVTHVNGWKKSQILEELTGAGDDDERWGVVGVNMVDPVVLTGPYDDAANSLYDCVMLQWVVARTLRFTFDAAQNVETYIESVEIKGERGKLNSVIVTLQPTGDVT